MVRKYILTNKGREFMDSYCYLDRGDEFLGGEVSGDFDWLGGEDL